MTEPAAAAPAEAITPAAVEPAAGAPPVEGVVDGAPAEAPTPAPAPEGEEVAPVETRAPNPDDRRTREHREGLVRDAAYWRGVAEARAEVRQPANVAPPAPPPAPVPPDPAKYTHGEMDPDYIRALTKFELRDELAKEAAETARRTAENQSFEQRRAKFVEVHDTIEAQGADFAPAVKLLRSSTLDTQTKDMIVGTDNPGYVAAFFAAQPQELRSVLRLPAIQRALAIGKIDSKLGAALADAARPAAVAPITPTPTPTPRAPGNGPVVTTPINPETMPIGAVEQRLAELRQQRAASGW